MKVKFLRTVVLIMVAVLFVMISPVFAAFPEEPNVTNFSIRDGLPSNEVYRVVQDNNGFMWFATDRGVARYDFTEFKYYGIAEGLQSLLCTEMKLDKKGNLYVYCYKDGLYKYDESEDKFKRAPMPAESEDRNSFGFYFDDENNLNIAYGVYLYLKISEEGKLISKQDFPFNIDSITHATAILKSETPLLSSYYKVDDIYPSISYTEDFVIVNHASCYHVVSQTSGNLITTTGTELIIVNPKLKKSRIIPFETNHVAGMMYKGRELLFTSRGTYVVNSELEIIKLNWLSDYVITDGIVDYEGQLWVSTHDHGVLRVHQAISSIASPAGAITDVGLINKELYFSTSIGQVLKYDSINYQLDHVFTFSRPQYELQIKGDSIYNRFGTFYDLQSGTEVKSAYKNLGYPKISNSFRDSILVCGTRRIKFYRGINEIPSDFPEDLQSVRVSTFHKNNFYIGHKEGLSHFTYFFDQGVLHFEEEKLIEDSCTVTGLEIYQDYLFFSTLEKGFGILNIRTDSLRFLSELTYLPADRINSFKIYNSRLYLFTNVGMIVYNFKVAPEHVNFTLTQVVNSTAGLHSLDIKNGVKLGNKLILVGESSVDFVSLAELKDYSIAPKLVIMDMLSLESNSSIQTGLKLAYYENNIRFRYNLLSSFTSDNIEPYRVKLFHKSKILIEYFTQDPYAQFIDLEPGDYIFQVEGRNQFGVWSDPAEVKFSIKPHFTQTWWFFILISISLVLLGVLIVRERNRRKFQRLNYLRKLDVETIKNQEAVLSKLKLQMNPHFIYNALNSIQHLFFESRNKEANSYISTFSRLMRRGLENSDLKVIPVREEVKFIQDYMKIETLRFPDRFIFNLDVEEELIVEEYTIPPHLIQPVLENAIKHAFKGVSNRPERIDLSIKLSQDKNYIITTIEDNGLGIDHQKSKSLHNSKGLSIVQNQLEILNKSSEFKSSVEIYDKNKENPNDFGTKVILKIATDIE